jgi:hypothetical protein
MGFLFCKRITNLRKRYSHTPQEFSESLQYSHLEQSVQTSQSSSPVHLLCSLSQLKKANEVNIINPITGIIFFIL